MAKVRQDAWTPEDDLLLAETVLRHIREGSTQLNAFEEVGDALNRTSAACGFRWNAEVRNRYVHAIELAKKQRKEKKRAEAKAKNKLKQASKTQTVQAIENKAASELNIEQIIVALQGMKDDIFQAQITKSKYEQLETENSELKTKISELEKELAKANDRLKVVEEDYRTFIQIMERARKMTLLEEQGPLKAPAFRMDKNGNLEQIEQK